LEGKLENIDQLAYELGISRATAYNWLGNGERMIASVVASITEDKFRAASKQVRSFGATRVRKVLMQLSSDIAAMTPYRQLFEQNPEKALRMFASKDAPIQ